MPGEAFAQSDHTFAVCAYGESPYLRECVESLVGQSLKTRIILCTSTPNQGIENVAGEFNIPIFLSGQKPGIASDWNFAIKSAETPLVTIAHQDDIYCESYAEHMLQAMQRANHPLIFFTNYGELRGENRVDNNRLLNIKRKLLKPLENPKNSGSIKKRRHALSRGSAICCPSVTMAVDNLPSPIFRQGMKSNLDWEAWEIVSRLEGEFLYDPDILMYHRIHADSETSMLIRNNTRTVEDLEMLKRFWPAPVAYILNLVYARGQKSNA